MKTLYYLFDSMDKNICLYSTEDEFNGWVTLWDKMHPCNNYSNLSQRFNKVMVFMA